MAVPTGSPVSRDEDLLHEAPQAPSCYYYLITTLSTTCDWWVRCFSLRAHFHLVSLRCGASGQGLPCGVSVPLRGTAEGRQAGLPIPNTLSDSEDRAARDKEKHGPPQGSLKNNSVQLLPENWDGSGIQEFQSEQPKKRRLSRKETTLTARGAHSAPLPACSSLT